MEENRGDERLCASCDRCRSRKTKCDGQRPCGNCAAKYMKKHKLTSIEGTDPAVFECVYSPAKRRGPVPGRSAQVRKVNEMKAKQNHPQQQPQAPSGMLGQPMMDQQSSWNGLGSLGGGLLPGTSSSSVNPGLGSYMDTNQQTPSEVQQQLNLLQQIQHQRQQQQQQTVRMDETPMGEDTGHRQKQDGIPRTVSAHTHLLDRADPEGSRLYGYYKMSIDELFHFPATPTDEEYCLRLNVPGITPRLIPGSHLAALSAARFSEVALGALVANNVPLAMELCNAVVHCLRESISEPVQQSVLLEVAKAYYLLGVFRAFRGDMVRYFKYRRVCMTYIGKLEISEDTLTLAAAISFLDSWAYMIYNANDQVLPSVENNRIPPVAVGINPSMPSADPNAIKFNTKTDIASVVSADHNKFWIQGVPPIYINSEAPMRARALDALACAVRQCCDQANERFAQINKDQLDGVHDSIPEATYNTATASAISSHETELCARNMVLSAYSLIQQHESVGKGTARSEGLHLIISAMDAFLENSEEDGSSGFTDSQIQSLLSVCNTIIENPFLLHHAGPTYHLVTNAAVLLCHLLNGLYAMKKENKLGSMEAALFGEVLDTFVAVRKLLTVHRRKLPVKMRCHGLPRPTLVDTDDQSKTFIHMSETLLCACRGCQGFVLMACSPLVAAERARDSSKQQYTEIEQEAQLGEFGDMDQELEGLSTEFNMDDDALLGMFNSVITN